MFCYLKKDFVVKTGLFNINVVEEKNFDHLIAYIKSAVSWNILETENKFVYC